MHIVAFTPTPPPQHPTTCRLLSDNELRLKEGEEIYRVYEHEVPVRSTVSSSGTPLQHLCTAQTSRLVRCACACACHANIGAHWFGCRYAH